VVEVAGIEPAQPPVFTGLRRHGPPFSGHPCPGRATVDQSVPRICPRVPAASARVAFGGSGRSRQRVGPRSAVITFTRLLVPTSPGLQFASRDIVHRHTLSVGGGPVTCASIAPHRLLSVTDEETAVLRYPSGAPAPCFEGVRYAR
jgi:hypothetical protein